ncbi:MAG: carbohydrate ABC transporter permease [Treponema sp.]|nr:carbohydrate ABC transporter permease [Treponema sp.]
MDLSQRQRIKNNVNSGIYHIFMIAFGIVMLYPILWMIVSSFKPTEQIFDSISLIPTGFSLDNYIRGWNFSESTQFSFTNFFANSIYISSITTIGAVLSSSLVAYGFARIRFRGRAFWFSCMFLTLMLPYQVVMVPQYIMFFNFGWINTFYPLIVPQFCGQAFFIFLMVQFFRGVPMELDESAVIDGCNKFNIFIRILFPLIKPALITSAIFSFYWRWDDFLAHLLYLNRTQLYTVSLALRNFADPTSHTDWGAIFAMGSLSIVPSLVIFFLFQKYIVEGISTTGMKG